MKTINFLEAATDSSGGNRKIKKDDFKPKGRFPVIDQGAKFIAGYTDEDEDLCNTPSPVIIFGDHTRAVKFIDFEFAMGADGTKVLVAKEGVDSKYLYHAIKHLDIPTAGYSRHYKFLKESTISIPEGPNSLQEQKRIAAILDKADAIRRKRKQALDLTDTFLRSTFLQMFGDPVTNPMGWEVKPCENCSDILTGYAFKSSQYIPAGEGIKLCRGANILPNKLNWSDEVNWSTKYDQKIGKFALAEDDIVMAMDRPWISTGFKVAQITPSDLPSLLVQRTSRFRAHGEISNNYLYHLFQSPAFTQHCKPTETTIPHISPVELKSFPVPIPSQPKLQKFESICNILKNTRIHLQKALQASETLFSSLQQKAFTGEL